MHQLSDDDTDQRLEFCEIYPIKLTRLLRYFLKKIINFHIKKIFGKALWENIYLRLFFNVNPTGELYPMLQNPIEPLILEILEVNPDEIGILEITFQQNGAPAHYGAVRR